MKQLLLIVSVHSFIALIFIVQGDQSLDESTNTISVTREHQKPFTTTRQTKKRFIGIWTADYMQFGVPSGAIVNNIAKNSPAAQFLRLDDVILAINGKNVRSSQDLIDAIPLIPPSLDHVMFDIDRDGNALSVSCTCLYSPPINLTPIFETAAPCSLRLVQDRVGNKIIVAPMAYVAHLYRKGSMASFETKVKEVAQQGVIGVYHSLRRNTWYTKGIHDLAVASNLINPRFRNEIATTLSEALAHYDKTKEKQSCYVIHPKSESDSRDLIWSVNTKPIGTNQIIGESNLGDRHSN